MRKINHEERKVDCIGDGSLFDGHEVLHAPELFSVAEVELDLEAQAIVVNQGIVCEFEITAEKHRMCADATLQIGFDQDHDIEWVGKALVQHRGLVNISANPLVLTGRHLITLWNGLIIELVARATTGARLLLFTLVLEVERRIVTQFRDQVQSQMNDRGSTAMNDYLPWEFICKTSGGQPRKQQIFM